MVLDAADHDTWSVGSFFTNPVVAPDVYERLAAAVDGPVPHYPAPDGVKLAAGWLVERAGFGKGYPEPTRTARTPCRLSTKHALALTNRGGAGAEDVMALARTIRDGVRDVFGITLIPEPVLLGVQAVARETLPTRARARLRRGRAGRFSPVSLNFREHHPAPRGRFNRRAALAALGLGVFAPSVLAACGEHRPRKQAEKKEPPAPQLKYQPADATDDVVPIAPVSVEVSDGWFQHVALTNSSGKAVARRLQPGPHRLHDHRAAGLRRDLHLERLGRRPRRQGDSGRGQVHHGVADQEDRRRHSSWPTARPSGSRRRSSSSSMRRSATRPPSKRRSPSPPTRPSRAAGPGCPTRRRVPASTTAPASTTRRAPPSTSRPSSTACRSATAPTAPRTSR